MSRWNLGWLIGITAAALLGISLTYSAPPQANKKQRDLKLVVDVLDEVQKRYVRELDQDKMRELVENMINGGLEKLDPHSAFIGADEYNDVSPTTLPESIGLPIHRLALVALGVDIFDNLDFERVVETARRLNRYEFMFSAAPLRVVKGTGSPINPLAIF